MDQILANLCVNARDAIGGPGKVTIETRRVTLAQDQPGIDKAGPYVRLTVRDTGHGVPPEYVDKIFEPFFTTKPLGRGTGLGLSTVHGIVAQNGGFITVASAMDEGTEFRVHLPLTHAPLTASLIPEVLFGVVASVPVVPTGRPALWAHRFQ